MFGLFKRKLNRSSELEFLIFVISKLGHEYQKYLVQINEKYVKDIDYKSSMIPNFVSIKYKPEFFQKFEDKTGQYFKVSNISICNSYDNKELKLSIYFGYGIILGYALDEKIKKYKFNLNSLNVEKIKYEVISEDKSIEKVKKVLSLDELGLINENEIYSVSIQHNDTIFHLKDLEDGDFIGIDKDNNLYKVTHDPYEKIPLQRQALVGILNGSILV